MGSKSGDSDSSESFDVADDKNVDGYNYAFGPCRIFLRLLGAWPDPYDDNDCSSFTRFLVVTLTMLVFATISQTVKMVLLHDNLNALMEILSNCNLPTSIATVKLVGLWYHRYVLSDLVRQIVNDWDTPRCSRELEIMWTNAKISRLFSIGCILMTEATLAMQAVVGFARPVSLALKSHTNETIDWPLYMIGWFPYDPQATPNYELTMFGQLMSNVFASTSFSSADSFFVVLMLHLIGQLSILKISLFELSDGVDCANENEVLSRFSLIHMRHNRLWRFAMAVEDSFNAMFLIQLVPCIFALCTQGYQLIMISGADDVSVMDLIFMIYFLVLFLFTLFTYCYIAEILRQESVDVANAAYNCNWTILPAKNARLLVFIIIRSQHPFEITAGKFASFSLQLYCRILKTSAGYLSMLLAVKDRMIEQSPKLVL